MKCEKLLSKLTLVSTILVLMSSCKNENATIENNDSPVVTQKSAEFATSNDLVEMIRRANLETPDEKLYRILALTEKYRDQIVVDQIEKYSNKNGYLWATNLLIVAGLLDEPAAREKNLKIYEERKYQYEGRYDGPLPLTPTYIDFDRLNLIGDLGGLDSIMGDIRRSTSRVYRDNDSVCHPVQRLYLTYAQKSDFYYEGVLRQVRYSFNKAKKRHKIYCAKVIKASGLDLSADEQKQIITIFEEELREKNYAGDYAIDLLKLEIYHPDAEKQLWAIVNRDASGDLGLKLEAMSILLDWGRDIPNNIFKSIFKLLTSAANNKVEDRVRAIAFLIKSEKLKKADLEKINFSKLALENDFSYASRYLIEVIIN